MNKGFTLAELLIVIVLIGVLALIAMPKYQTAVERGRALEALENVCMMQEYIYVHRLLDKNFSINAADMADRLKEKYFTLSVSSDDTVSAERKGSEWNYTISMAVGGTNVSCSGNDCVRLSLDSVTCPSEGEEIEETGAGGIQIGNISAEENLDLGNEEIGTIQEGTIH